MITFHTSPASDGATICERIGGDDFAGGMAATGAAELVGLVTHQMMVLVVVSGVRSAFGNQPQRLR